jgi:hypothetical protein
MTNSRMKTPKISLCLLSSVLFHFLSIININAQCTNITSPALPKNNEPIQTLEVKIVTDNGLFSGTDRDVWIDIGPKAWKLTGGFGIGSTRTFTIDPNRMDENSNFDVDSVPLFINDIKFIRLEKKGIALTDIPPPSPEFIALLPIARKIGGITNAPDSLEDFLALPGGITPQSLLGDARKELDTANLALNEAQGRLSDVQNAFSGADKLVSEKTKILTDAETEVDRLQGIAGSAASDLSNLDIRLNDAAFKFTVKRVCETVRDRSTCFKSVIFGPPIPFLCFITREVCHNENIITDAWKALNNTRPDVESRKVAAENAVRVARLGLDPLKQALEAAKVARQLVQVQLDIAKSAVDTARNAVTLAQDKFNKLDDFVKHMLPNLPSLDIPKPGQWVPKSITLSVNGIEYIRCDVNERLRRGHPSWTGFWEPVSPEDIFVNGLRVTNMSASKGLDEFAAGLTTFLKVNDISGFEPGPIKKAKIIGVLKHEPSPGKDEFVSLDLLIESIKVDGKELINRVNHPRFIRVEYRHRKNSNEDDDRYKEWHPEQRLQVEGIILRDTDRATFYEIHPEKKGNIKPKN